ncbi:MAG: hypothetical protein WCQ50_01130 [Spirochaetota bacterium]
MADGPDYVSAVVRAEEVIGEWIETALEFGPPIPEALGRRLVFQ